MTDQPQVLSPPSGFHLTHPNSCSLSTTYTNFFRASGSAEELILDFGLDPHRRTEDAPEPAVMLQRLVLTWNNARRLAVMLHELIQMHDKTHAPRNPDQPTPPPPQP